MSQPSLESVVPRPVQPLSLSRARAQMPSSSRGVGGPSETYESYSVRCMDSPSRMNINPVTPAATTYESVRRDSVARKPAGAPRYAFSGAATPPPHCPHWFSNPAARPSMRQSARSRSVVDMSVDSDDDDDDDDGGCICYCCCRRLVFFRARIARSPVGRFMPPQLNYKDRHASVATPPAAAAVRGAFARCRVFARCRMRSEDYESRR
jgi:hypothetical protein